jgi:hypothetical protein
MSDASDVRKASVLAMAASSVAAIVLGIIAVGTSVRVRDGQCPADYSVVSYPFVPDAVVLCSTVTSATLEAAVWFAVASGLVYAGILFLDRLIKRDIDAAWVLSLCTWLAILIFPVAYLYGFEIEDTGTNLAPAADGDGPTSVYTMVQALSIFSIVVGSIQVCYSALFYSGTSIAVCGQTVQASGDRDGGPSYILM